MTDLDESPLPEMMHFIVSCGDLFLRPEGVCPVVVGRRRCCSVLLWLWWRAWQSINGNPVMHIERCVRRAKGNFRVTVHS